jgi:hypothetical protein
MRENWITMINLGMIPRSDLLRQVSEATEYCLLGMICVIRHKSNLFVTSSSPTCSPQPLGLRYRFMADAILRKNNVHQPPLVYPHQLCGA